MNALKVYKASAGSGKTFRLAVDYVKLLVQYAGEKEFAHILAVTFTNKATAEMKSRILSHLYGVGGTERVLESSRDFFEKLKEQLRASAGAVPSDEEIRRRCRIALHQILHDYSYFRVQTIDAFFQTVLRGLAHELNLTANMQVDISDSQVLTEAVDRIIDRLQDEPEVQAWLLDMLQERMENNERWDVTAEMKRFGRTIFNETYLRDGDRLRQVLADAKQLGQFAREVAQQRDGAVAAVKHLGKRLHDAVAEQGVAYADFSNGRTLESLAEQLQAGTFGINIGARINGWINDPLSLVKAPDRKKRPELIDAADAVSSVLAEVVGEFSQKRFQYNSAQLALRHIRQLHMLDYIDREVAAINAETSRFNLAKTPIFLNRMIRNDDAPFVFEKIGARLHHIMIDEFQDTSRLQWDNFLVLLRETYARGGQNLLVGDVKQSIYRWRGGDWRMLGYIDQVSELNPDVSPLDTNFRSFERVVDFNNAFFRLAADQLDELSEDAQQQLGIGKRQIHDDPQGPERGLFGQAYGDVRQAVAPKHLGSGYVSITAIDVSDERFKHDEDERTWILNDMCQRIKHLIASGVSASDITILVRWNSEIPLILSAFAATDGMPPIVSDEAFLLRSSLAVQLLVNALRVMDDPDEPVAAEFLRVHAPEFRAEQLPFMPLYELLQHLYEQLRLADIPDQDAYLFGFFDAVTDYLQDGQADVHSFLQYWDETLATQSISAGRIDGVRILSIHKSKGLQFHTVLVPFCSWDFERWRWDTILWCRPTDEPYARLGLLPITAPVKSISESVFKRDYAEEHLLSQLDELNALYVAFTRAESNLLVWAPYKPTDDQPANVAQMLVSVLPKLGLTPADEAEGIGHYELGECLVRPPKVKTQLAADEVNRLEPEYEQVRVQMASYQGLPEFRQSNRSQQFVRQAGIDAVTDDDEVAILMEQARQQEYIDMGLLLHSLFQQIASVRDIDRVLDKFEAEGLLDADVLSRQNLRKMIDRTLQKNPKVARWFDGSWQLFNECGIAFIDPRSHQPVTQRPDRVMLSADQREAIVVDFKFGRSHEGYTEQVQSYMHLIAQMYPDATVHGYLWYVLRGRVEEVV